MTDEAYTFMHDVKDKKSIAASAYRKHTGRRGCTLPFESVPYNKRSELNGEVKTVANLDRPMNWSEFKALPRDFQEKYLNRLKEFYGVSNRQLATMMIGHPCKTLDNYVNARKLKVISSKGRTMTWQQQESWKAFCNGVVGGGDATPTLASTLLRSSIPTPKNDQENPDQFDAAACAAPYVEKIQKEINKQTKIEDLCAINRLQFERDFYKERYFELLAILGERK